ncbi:MAG TPA: hypothetical protein DHV62_06110 [Elusimicrobia bacterium]|nr:hypothetical protein [Elusimicrobiota bacterium]
MKNKVLEGKKILLTRASEQIGEIAKKLDKLGAEVLKLPTIRIATPKSYRDLDKVIREIENYQWIIFTSQNGVEFFFQRYLKKGKFLKTLTRLAKQEKIKIGAIGPATEKRIKNYHLRVVFEPKVYTSKGIIRDLKKKSQIEGTRILLPRADIAPQWLPQELTKLGAQVTQVVAYRTIREKKVPPRIKKMLKTGGIDLVIFTSSSTVKNFLSLVGKNNLSPEVKFASIGPVTTKTAKELGLKIEIQAQEHTLNGLVKAILRYTDYADKSPDDHR